MEGLSSYVVTCTSIIRVQADSEESAAQIAREIARADGPDDVTVERTDSPSDRNYS